MFWSDSAALGVTAALAFMLAGTITGLLMKFGRG